MKIVQLNDKLFGNRHQFTFVQQNSIFHRAFGNWAYTEIEVENEDSTIK